MHRRLSLAIFHVVAELAFRAEVRSHSTRKDASNAFKAALQAFGVTWERKTKGAEKMPA